MLFLLLEIQKNKKPLNGFSTKLLTPNTMLQNANFAGLFATFYLFAFVMVIALGYGDLAMTMFLLSPVLMVWLVYTVLRYGKPSGRTFDEYFYDDVNIRADKLRE
jgi:hypothetical protein